MSAATVPAPTRAAQNGPPPVDVHMADAIRVAGHAPTALGLDVRTLALDGPRDVPDTSLGGEGAILVLLLDPSPERARAVGRALVDEEAARAARVRPGRGAKFTAVRGTLRTVLARELDLAPREVPIVYGEHGKPALDPELGCRVHFNVSHTGGLAAIAIARGRELGVDVELHRPRKRLDLLARAALTAAERARFELLPEGERLAAFLDAWSAKEAYSKLLGRGLGLSFRGLELRSFHSRVVRLPVGPLHSGALAA
ncbi:MAG TPA: 4'-phosphopantetheinyl transferase superfamily protein [Thermoleophilaceae bacterium]|nr:4'-phosphopantetheinyl transferase superfamily protein [Thermoleophilaceae bacterium]